MIKRIIIFIATTVLLFLFGYFCHKFYLNEIQKVVRFTPLSMYGFHAIACVLVYLVAEVIFKFLPNETGYLFLASTMIKIGVFLLLFKNDIFTDIPLTKLEKGLLIIPLFIFLITETTGVALLLNKSNFKEINSK